ncbi:hypothetical protein [Streptomyces venezuelae]|uniref:hypothetical protein n=1 Tax=Streptomyces venezuelae TaxID=54571 RepID=UPI0036645BB9
MTADAPLTRESFRRLHPITVPRPVSRLPDRVWTDEEWDRIRRGYRARDMDEKWNVFVEDDVLFMHRSWTGYGVYEATFAPTLASATELRARLVELTVGASGQSQPAPGVVEHSLLGLRSDS